MLAFSARPAFFDPTGLSTQLRRRGRRRSRSAPDHAAIEQLVGDIAGGEPTSELVRFRVPGRRTAFLLVELVLWPR
jgi:hypothetical protein